MSRSNSRNKSYSDDSDDFIIKRIKMEPDTILGHEDDIMAQLQQESSDLEPSFSQDSDNYDDSGILTQNMDIREPLSTLKNLLEQKLTLELTDYSFWLQDAQMLESHKNLVDQCVQGEGLVQINVQIKSPQRKINIVDVLKPPEDYNEVADDNSQTSDDSKNRFTWVEDAQFKQDQIRLKIPSNPNDWTQPHVRHWIQWAVRQFNLASVRLVDWNITGSQLCNLTLEEFRSKIPSDPDAIFWTHLELLKDQQTVAVLHKKPDADERTPEKPIKVQNQKSPKNRLAMNQHAKLMNTSAQIELKPSDLSLNASNRTSNNTGQIQLWQFLLELLTDREHLDCIRWVGSDGEFKLIKPEIVAQLWGARKKKPSMNYEKLSRALRYYYDGDMISKVPGKRFVYKFVCDLKQLLGYSAAELGALVEGQHYIDE